MDARERFVSTIRFDRIDRPFYWETHNFWDKTLEMWHQEGLPSEIDKGRISSYLGMDKMAFIPVRGGWAGTPYHPMFEEKIIEDRGENVVILEKDGIVKMRRKGNRDGSAPQLIKFPVEGRKDFEELKPRLDWRDRGRLTDSWEKRYQEFLRRDYPLGMFVIGPFGHLRNLMGDERLFYTLYDDPEFIHLVLAHWAEFYKGYISIVCNDVIPDFFMIWEDMCYRNGPLISPASYIEFMAGYLKDVIVFSKGLGVEGFIVDCDGDLRKMIPVYLECGINCFFPMEVQAGVDIVEIRKQYGKAFSIIGGIDKNVLATGRDEIKNEIEKKVPFMLTGGGYIPALDHACPPNVSYENYMYFTRLVREIGGKTVQD
jgi:uroporphyrinogen-III decarboxylase